MKNTIVLLISLCLVSSNLFAQKEKGLESITEMSVKGQLEFLSSDWTEGRAVGTRGNYLAGDYIASMFKVYGLKPAGDIEMTRVSRSQRWEGEQSKPYRDYFQYFYMVEYEETEDQVLSLTASTGHGRTVQHFQFETDFSLLQATRSETIEGPIVFVGYGIKDDEKNYNDYSKVDVKNRIVLMLDGFPGHLDSSSVAFDVFHPRTNRERYRMIRAKFEAAKQEGALAILYFTADDEILKELSANVPFRYNEETYEGDRRRTSFYDMSLRLASDTLEKEPLTLGITPWVAHEILAGSGISIQQFELQVARSLKPAPRLIPNKQMTIQTDVETRLIRGRNVVAMIEGELKDEVVVVGAHYDHLGKYDGYIWNGADDNASGTVGVLSIARAFMQSGIKPKRTIIFAAWDAEEKGLYGSKYFVDHPSEPFTQENLYLNLNYDMISRDNDDDTLGIKCRMSYSNSMPELKTVVEEVNAAYGIGLDITFRGSDQPGGGSDHAPFARRGIPVYYFMAGFPREYHQPGDHVDLVNIPKMTRIIRLGYLSLWELANGE